PADWEKALVYTLDQLVLCSVCKQPSPFPYWQPPDSKARCCHFCHAAFVNQALMLRLFRGKGDNRAAYEATGRVVVRTRDFPDIYDDMLSEDTRHAGNSPYRQRIGKLLNDPGQCRLQNEGKEEWKVYLPGAASVI